MNAIGLIGATVCLLAVSACSSSPEPAGRAPAAAAQPAPSRSADDDAVDTLMKAWGPRPQLAARQMMAAYGMPQEATSEQLVWHRQGPYKRIVVTRVEIPHDFPKPHMDYMAHTVDYRVPSDKASALIAYDGSVTIDRTAGELSARCDLEGHNILTLNLAHDIITGKLDAKQARMAFGQNVVRDAKGEMPPYVTTLQFNPVSTGGMDADTPVIPGSPMRPANGAASGDSEALGYVIAVHENEILAAAEAGKKAMDAQVKEYARTLHVEHGKGLEETMMLAQKIGVTPMETPGVDALRLKGASELATLVATKGVEFDRAYVYAMVRGHDEVLQMIDTQLMKSAQHDAFKTHLTATRSHVAAHLEKAKTLQASTR